MKCISIYNPWAYLISAGAKKIETRSWQTPYRGKLLIHASKKWDNELNEICYQEPFYSVLMSDHKNNSEIFEFGNEIKNKFLFGYIIAIAELYDCRKMTEDNLPVGNEFHFGDYKIGRYMWLLKNVKKIIPVRFTGMPGMFDVPDNLIKIVK